MRRHFQSAFVPASTPSSSTTPRFASPEDLGNVPPPPCLTQPNLPGRLATMKEQERQKEAEYAALMYEGGVMGGKTSAKVAQERKKRLYEDEYLEKDSDDEGDGGGLAYQPGPDSPPGASAKAANEDDEDDPLDAFMAGVNQQIEVEKSDFFGEIDKTNVVTFTHVTAESPLLEAKVDEEASMKKEKEKKASAEAEKADKDEDEKKDKKQLGRTDIDDEDMQESYFRFLEEQELKARAQEDDEDVHEYDEDGNIVFTWKKIIDPLPVLDHATVSYAPFHKNFYVEHDDIKALSFMGVESLRSKLGVKVAGMYPPKPVASFAHFGFDENLMNAIRKSEFEHPTPIQAQAIPAALSGRDVLGVAKTGSGKTAAYLWPAIIHIMDQIYLFQPDLKPGDGPIALIVVPTRELAIQVYQEAKKYCKVYNINTVCAYGGGSKWEQQNALQEGAEIVVCTPGRIIDMVKIGATNLTRVTYLVFDEADRMFDLGFEAQVRSIADHVRPDRQCLMFSATFKKKVEALARQALHDPIRIVQGEIGEANEDVVQIVEVFLNPAAKWTWLLENLVRFTAIGKVLIFVTKKLNSEELANNLKLRDFPLCLLHGDMQQHERNETLTAFRKEMPILVATDVAARGLDIPEIRTVINYDVARDIDTHVHRIGRTGRAGEKGWAYTLVTEGDKEFLGHLVRNLESVNQTVPSALLSLAMKAPWFRSSREKEEQTMGGSGGARRAGLGFKPKSRPGFGSGSSNAAASPLTAYIPGGGGGGTLEALKAKAAASTGASAGGPTNRLAAMKAAFSSNYRSTFKSSTADDFASASTLRPAVTDPTPDWKRAAAAVAAQAAAIAAQQKTTEEAAAADAPTFGRKKRSRWE